MRRAPLLLILLATPAAAFEPTGSVVADAFLETLERGGYTDVAVEEVGRSDGSTVLTGVTGTSAPEIAQTLRLGRVTINGGIVNSDNALVADSMTYDDVSVTEAGGETASTIRSVAITEPVFPTGDIDPSTGVATLLGSFETLELTDITANAPDMSEVKVGAISATLSAPGGDAPASGSFSITDLAFDVSVWDEPAATQMRDLGYENLMVDFSGDGHWEAETGRAVLENATVSVEDLGTLTLEAALDGLTDDTLAQLQANAENMAELLTLLQNVTLSGLTVRYADAGLTERLIGDAAERAGVPPEALIQGLVATVPDALAMLDAPALTEQVTAAAETFLNDPGTLTIKAAPAEPITLSQVLGAGLMSPQALPALLNLDISAAK